MGEVYGFGNVAVIFIFGVKVFGVANYVDLEQVVVWFLQGGIVLGIARRPRALRVFIVYDNDRTTFFIDLRMLELKAEVVASAVLD